MKRTIVIISFILNFYFIVITIFYKNSDYYESNIKEEIIVDNTIISKKQKTKNQYKNITTEKTVNCPDLNSDKNIITALDKNLNKTLLLSFDLMFKDMSSHPEPIQLYLLKILQFNGGDEGQQILKNVFENSTNEDLRLQAFYGLGDDYLIENFSEIIKNEKSDEVLRFAMIDADGYDYGNNEKVFFDSILEYINSIDISTYPTKKEPFRGAMNYLRNNSEEERFEDILFNVKERGIVFEY